MFGLKSVLRMANGSISNLLQPSFSQFHASSNEEHFAHRHCMKSNSLYKGLWGSVDAVEKHLLDHRDGSWHWSLAQEICKGSDAVSKDSH